MPSKDEAVDEYFHQFITSALNRGDWSDSRTNRFTQGQELAVPTEQETAWTPDPAWDFRGEISEVTSIVKYVGTRRCINW
jgi:hypothetical protein